MTDRFLYFVCGILSGANDPKTWSNQAQWWVVEEGYAMLGNAAGFTYFDDVVGGTIHLNEQADLMARDFEDAMSEGLEIIAAGHSNGVRLLLRMLKRFPQIKIKRLALIAGADDPDCNTNGLNEAVARGQVEEVQFFTSPDDEVLGLGAIVSYGMLGKVGPTNMPPALKAISTTITRNCKHSDWVGKFFVQTVSQIVA